MNEKCLHIGLTRFNLWTDTDVTLWCPLCRTRFYLSKDGVYRTYHDDMKFERELVRKLADDIIKEIKGS